MTYKRSQQPNLDFVDAGELVIKQVDDGEEGIFSGHAAFFNNRDLVDDVILPGAFEKTLNRKKVKDIRLLWQHDWMSPIGINKQLREDEKGLTFESQLATESTAGKDAHILLKMGAVDRMSIGFSIPDKGFEIVTRSNSRIRYLKEIDLWETSVVTFPANPKARVRRVKHLDNLLPIAEENTEWHRKDAEERIDEFINKHNLNEEEVYNKVYLYNNQDVHKLLIADVINDDIIAIPKAIKAAAAALVGVGVDKVDHDNELKEIISLYYENMREQLNGKTLSLPWENSSNLITPILRDAIDVISTKNEVEKFLRSIGFSKQLSKSMASGYIPKRDAPGMLNDNRRDAEDEIEELLTLGKRLFKH